MFSLRDTVTVIKTSRTGIVVEVRDDVDEPTGQPIKLNCVEFNRDFATRQFYRNHELEIVTRGSQSEVDRAFHPSRSSVT